MTRSPRAAGFTLLEVVIALAIVGALLAVAYGGLRVGLSAWRQGEDRAEAHQHVRGQVALLARSLAAAYPYRMVLQPGSEGALQFDGHPDQLSFVTLSPPFPLAPTIAFTAVRVTLEAGEEPGLTLRERALPNQEPFVEAKPVFRDPAITSLALRYLRRGGSWEERWDGAAERDLPAAVEIRIATAAKDAPPAFTIPLQMGGRE